MYFTEFSKSTKFSKESKMKAPRNLKHKPILEVANYESLDGHRANNTDAKCLSIGVAQWNNGIGTELSAKVWRQVDDRWSRQSEELPLNRVLDLATLVCESQLYANGGKLNKNSDLPINKVDSSEITNEILKSEFKKNEQYLNISLKRLANALKRLGY